MSNFDLDTDRVDALVALKAFLLGRMIRDQSERIAPSIEMIDVAIETLTSRDDDESQRRLVFYSMLKSELLEGGDGTIEARKNAKHISENIQSKAFEYYLKIVEGVWGIEHGVNLGVYADDPMNHAGAIYRALGDNAYSFSDSDLKFIGQTNLKDILKYHNIKFS